MVCVVPQYLLLFFLFALTYFCKMSKLLHCLGLVFPLFLLVWFCCTLPVILPSELWRCWLGGRKGIRPVKNEWWGADMVICLEQGADLHMAQLMPLPLTFSCFSKIQIGFTFLYPDSPGKRAVKRVCVCVHYMKALCMFCCCNFWLSCHQNLCYLRIAKLWIFKIYCLY